MATRYYNGGLKFKTNAHRFKTGDKGTKQYNVGVPLPPNIILPPNKLNIPNIPNISNIPRPPRGPSTYYTNIYKAIQQEQQIQSNLSNYNDPLEINSMRDVILGAFNPNMKHTINTGIMPIDAIADVIMHSYNHFIKPTFLGEAKIAALNLLTDLGETTDMLANPIKAAAQAIVNGDDIGKAVKRATIGDETGIYNYDWDTGNGVADLVLEVISDPLNWVSFGGKALVSSALDVTSDVAFKGSRKAVKLGAVELAQELSAKTGKRITVNQVTELAMQTYKETAQKAFKNSVIKNAEDIIKTKQILNSNIADEILKSSNAKFTKRFTKNLKSITDISNLDEAAFKGLYEGIEKLNKNVLTKNAADIVNSVGLRMVVLEDKISRKLLQVGLTSSGIYPLYKVYKKSNIKYYFDNKIIHKATQNNANEIIHPKESFVKATDYDGVVQTVQEDINLQKILSEKYNDPNFQPEREASLISQQIALRVYEAYEDFKKGIDNPQALKQSILNRLQSIDSYTEFKNIEDVYSYVENLEQRYFKAIKDDVINTEFTSVKQALKELIADFKKLDELDIIRKEIKDNENITSLSQEVLGFTKTFDKFKTDNNLPDSFNVNSILKQIPSTEYTNTIQYIYENVLPTLNNISDSELINLLNVLDSINLKNDDLEYLKELINNFLQNRTYDNLEELYDMIKYIQEHRLKDIKILPKTFQDILIPIDEITGIRKTNKVLTDLLASAKYNTEFPNDFKKTRIYNEASDLVKQATDRNTRLNELIKEVTDIKDLDKEYLKKVINNITEISKLNDEGLLKTNVTLGRSSRSLINFANYLTDEQGIFGINNWKNMFERLETNKKQLIDLNPGLEDGIIQNFQEIKVSLRRYVKVLQVLSDNSDINNFRGLYYELYEAHNRLKMNLNQIHRLTDKYNPFDINISTKYKEGAQLTGLDFIDQLEEEVLNVVSPELYDSKFLQLNNNNYYIRLQLEKTHVQNRFNNLKSLQNLRQDPEIQKLVNNVINCKSSKKLKQLLEEQGINEATQAAAIHLAVLQQDIRNYDKAVIMFDNFVDTLNVSSEQKLRVKTAIHTSLDYAKRKDLLKTDAELLTDELVKNVQGYVYGADFTSKKQDLDTLIENIAKKEGRTITEIEDDILKLVNTIPDIDPTTATRHSALYDTVAQIYTYEKTTGKTFTGNMLDIESTKLLNKQNKSNGLITEITVVHKDLDGKLTTPFNKRVRVTKDTLENRYMQTKPYLEKLKTIKGFSIEDYQAKYLADTDEVLEKNILEEFSEWIRKLPSKTKLSTFNGDDFDLIMISERFKNVLKEYDFTEVLSNLDVEDYFKELSKDRFRFAQKDILKIHEIFDQIINNQRSTLGKYRLMMNYPIKVIGGVDGRFIDTAKQFLDLDSLKQLDLGAPGEMLLSTLDTTDEDTMLDVLETLVTKANKANIRENIFSSISDPTIRKYMYDLLQDYIEEARLVGRENQALKDIIIPGDLFDNAKRNKVQENILREIQNNLIENITDENYKAYLKEHAELATNLTQLLSLGINGDPMYAYKKFDGSVLSLWDRGIIPVNTNTLDNVYRKLNRIINNNDKIYNVDSIIPFKQDIYNMIQDIKNAELTDLSKALVIDTDNLQFAYSELDTLWTELKTQAINSKINTIAPQKLIEELDTKYKDLVQVLEDGTPFVKVSINTHNIEFITPRTVRWNKTQQMELTALKDLSIKNSRKIDTLINTDSGKLNITKESRTAGILHQKLLDIRLNNKDRKVSNKFRTAGISTTNLRLGWATHCTLNSTPEQLVSEIVNANKQHVKVISKPKDNNYFNNLNKFNELLEKEKELKEFGIKMEYDETTERLYLGIDTNKFKITLNKNTSNGARYCLNGKAMIPNTFESIPYDVFMSYVTGPKEYVDTLYEWFIKLENMQPELKGRTGITNYKENYDRLVDFDRFGKLSSTINDDDYMPFLNQSFLGDYDTLQKDIGPMYADALYLYSNTSSKITTQLAKHLEYGQFIMDTGIQLNSDIIQKLDSKQLNEWLRTNLDYVAVYLADAKRANGGFELRRINQFNDTTMKEAKRLNAVIIPYQQYIRSAEQINNYHYNNSFERIMGKITNAYKTGWLSFSPGLILRNIIDSGMKNYIEGESIPDITMKYIQAFDLYNKYTKVMHDIQQMSSDKRYTLDNAKIYFKQKDRLLDSKTYHFIYNFMNENGMNTLKTGNNDLYSWAMKPMGYTEKINRLVQYLNLDEQGMDYNSIIRHISETHFDYSTKTQFDFVTQLYIPFWTYASNNITYIANLIDKHPSFLRNYFNVYTPIWDFDELNYEELAQNISLQNQILSGNIPLKMFGYQDKEITKTIDTKYGPKEQTVTNTAVLKMGASILDGFNFFVNPYNYIKEKMSPPVQVVIDSIVDYTDSALGNNERFKWSSKEEAETDYMRNFGSTSVQALFKDPSKGMQLAPGLSALIPNNNLKTLTSAGINMYNRFNQSKVQERTNNNILASVPSVFGATSRWGEFKNEPRKTYSYPTTYKSAPRSVSYYNFNYNRSYPISYRVNHKGQSVKYYLRYPQRTYYTGKIPYTAYSNMLRRIYSPNTAHRFASNNINSNMQTIPQYLYSYYGKNRQGKSKILSWMRMSPRFKVKSTLRRIASP